MTDSDGRAHPRSEAPAGDDARSADDGTRAADDSTLAVADGAGGLVDDGVTPASDDATGPADDEEVEPVELLVQLAEEGEIEPWDIDIVRVTDAFLSKLDETDLRTSGRALFYASVLLRMKGDALLAADDEDEEPEPEPWELALEGGEDAAPGFDPVDALEAEMDRRLERKHARGSPETLEDLVRELREAERESWWKRSRTYDTSGSPRGFSRGTQTLDYRSADDFRAGGEPTEADVTGTTHKEDIEEVIETVNAALSEQYDAGRAEVLFAELRTAGGTPVTTYLALLFLAHRGDLRLRQDDLFGDLWIREADAKDDEADAGAGEADEDAERRAEEHEEAVPELD
ncbi:MAG: segregation/condensation protein A [Salinigranum sp.]